MIRMMIPPISAWFTCEGLAHLDGRFLECLSQEQPHGYEQLKQYRAGVRAEPGVLSQWIISCAPVLEQFLSQLFCIEDEVRAARSAVERETPIFIFKKK